MTIGIEIVNEKYLNSESSLLEKAVQLLHEVIFNRSEEHTSELQSR